MTVKLITEDILEEAHFSSATEQEGEFWEQPTAGSGNAGQLRPFTSRQPQDLVLRRHSTGDGTNSTIICSDLSIFGDDYFIGATVEVTSGPCAGESKTVTDFAQSTGTLTVSSAFTGQITNGIAFTLTLAFSTRDFRVEIVGAGDTGDAFFKWSHNGGANYLQRHDLNTDSWVGKRSVVTSVDTGVHPVAIIQMTNKDVLMVYNDGSNVQYITSSDGGLTWSSATKLHSGDHEPGGLIRLRSGRLWVSFSDDDDMYYSDDNAANWTTVVPTNSSDFNDLVELDNGQIIGVYHDADDDIKCRSSYDGGFTFGDAVTIATDATNVYQWPTIEQADNGNVVCAYESDEDDPGSGHVEIKCKTSSDNGATWSAVIALASYVTYELYKPRLCKDITGYLYCGYWMNTATIQCVYSYSITNGALWTYKDLLANPASHQKHIHLCIVDGHEMWAAYREDTDNTVYIERGGVWEAYDDGYDSCVAIDRIPQKLACNAWVTWRGGEGVVGDSWSFLPDYYYSMKNLIDDSPNRPWRSTRDNITCNINIDLGDCMRFFADGVAFFGCNVRKLSFQMSNDNFVTTLVSEDILFDVATGRIDAFTGNVLQDISVLSDYKAHELIDDYYLKLISSSESSSSSSQSSSSSSDSKSSSSSGSSSQSSSSSSESSSSSTSSSSSVSSNYSSSSSGSSSQSSSSSTSSSAPSIWKILDNYRSEVMLDAVGCPEIQVNNMFAIFQKKAARVFTGGNYRYMRIHIPAQSTVEGYYQIGVMVAGRVVQTTRSFAPTGYGPASAFGVIMERSPHGGMIPIRGSGRKRIFTLHWPPSEDVKREVMAVLNCAEGKNIVLIPDADDMTDIYLTKHVGDANQIPRWSDTQEVQITLEEVL